MGPQTPQLLRVSRASPGSEERCTRTVTAFGSVRSRSGWRWGAGVGITLAPSQVCDPGKERQLAHLPEPREAKQLQACLGPPSSKAGRTRGSPRFLCVSLCYFFPPVCGVFFFLPLWSCFIGIPVIKTWCCSLGALMWPAAWAGPSFLLPLQGRGYGFWSPAEFLGHLPRFSHSPSLPHPSSPCLVNPHF